MRRKLVALIAAALLALAGLTTASAAGLNLSSAGITTASAQPCTNTPIPLVRADPVWWGIAGYNAVTLTIPAACSGMSAQVTVYRTANGTAIGNGSHASLPTGNVTIAISNTYGGFFGDAHAFALTINGWHVPVQVN